MSLTVVSVDTAIEEGAFPALAAAAVADIIPGSVETTSSSNFLRLIAL